MMYVPKVAVLFGFGINCDHETAAVFDMVGGKSTRVHLNSFISGIDNLANYDILAVPGGFSFGDHLGSGRLMGNRMRFSLRDELTEFIKAGKPIIGICNGFQVLVKTGLLPGPEGKIPDFIQRASLTLNDSGRYEDRWVTLEFNQQSNCIWTQGITQMDCPVRHGEGKYVMPDRAMLSALSDNNQIAVRYIDPNDSNYDPDQVLPFPKSPNGSMMNIAGITDKTGLVFGLMPHPEAIYAQWLHPDYSRGDAPVTASDISWEGEGLQIFRNAVEYVISNN
tara:strand:- start:600 stop:1436 length:837 start_codon:yes stop_codon:yes gene_type:complete